MLKIIFYENNNIFLETALRLTIKKKVRAEVEF